VGDASVNPAVPERRPAVHLAGGIAFFGVIAVYVFYFLATLVFFFIDFVLTHTLGVLTGPLWERLLGDLQPPLATTVLVIGLAASAVALASAILG
jgi:hypothetical protein